MAAVLYHLNPKTERIGRCKAERGVCPFSSDSPHFATKEETQAHYEQQLEAEYGIFSEESSNRLSLTRDAVAKRLNLLPDSALEELIKERFKRGGYTPREVTAALESGEPFYVNYTGNQELVLDPDAPVTQKTFMRGACTVLAGELHRATGWPAVVYSAKGTEDYWQGHVAIKTPEGRYLDISGQSNDPTQSFGSLANDWEAKEVSTLQELRAASSGGDYEKDYAELGLLERYAAARIAFDLLENEGLLTG